MDFADGMGDDGPEEKELSGVSQRDVDCDYPFPFSSLAPSSPAFT